ncbi:hypothetical protein AB0D08_06655 [Kitasatospora sp. NPDC048540]|uniref:hypothetical protein n=1 Tax=Kitasatospora sp. NPDC048540 TaxID=3155634 RepID=UPI0034041137
MSTTPPAQTHPAGLPQEAGADPLIARHLDMAKGHLEVATGHLGLAAGHLGLAERHFELAADVTRWQAAGEPGGAELVLDPGFGRDLAPVPLEQRASVVTGATGLPVALLADGEAPVMISAVTQPVQGRMRYTSVEARYRDGLRVTVAVPFDLPPLSPEEHTATQPVLEETRMFSSSRLVVDGEAVEAVTYHPARDEAAVTRCAEVRGWSVRVSGGVATGPDPQVVLLPPGVVRTEECGLPARAGAR